MLQNLSEEIRDCLPICGTALEKITASSGEEETWLAIF